jgi:hypothetical protein
VIKITFSYLFDVACSLRLSLSEFLSKAIAPFS